MREYLSGLVKKNSADYLEIRLEDTSDVRISFQGERLEEISESQRFGGNIRAQINGAWGFVSFNSPDDLEKKVGHCIRNAEIASQRLKGAEKIKMSLASPVTKVIRDEILNDPSQTSLSRKVDILKGYNEIIMKYSQEIKSSMIRYFDRKTKLIFVNSIGTAIERDKIDLGCNLVAIAVKGSETQTGFVGSGSSNDFRVILNLEKKIREACYNAVEALDIPSVTGGEYTVIIDPILAGTFIHEAFGHLSEGDNIYENLKLQEIMKLGREFGGRNLNVYDSGLDVGCRGYVPFDDEGVPGQKTYLIKEGKLVGRLHSLETASKMNESPTGNARAISYQYPPICRMRNTCIENGDVPLSEMIKGIKKGIYACKAVGGQTNGEMFTFTAAEAYHIEQGKISYRVKDVTLSGNVFTALANIKMVGNDFAVHDSAGGCGKGGQMPLPVSHGAPHILIENVLIGGKN